MKTLIKILFVSTLMFVVQNCIGQEVEIHYHENGEISIQKSFIDGQPHGKWFYYFENGDIQKKETYKDGKLNGEWMEYFQDGQLKEKGNYKDGEWNGKRVRYFPTNSRTSRISWDYIYGERLVVALRYNQEGLLWMKTTDKKIGNKLESELIIYYKNGKIKTKGKKVDGKHEGEWVTYDKKGNVFKVETYIDGERIE
jgi:uncharacterized protein